MNLLATFIFFTRLPFWKIREVPEACFKHVVPYWPFVGWLTGGIMAGTLWLAMQAFPYPVAILFALIVRLLVTGALHEDGLADFFDGFGGGTSRQRILAIMKDSHIGSYGVIALLIYFLLIWSLLISLSGALGCLVLLVGDPFAKFVSSQIINVLPYARKEEESKAKVIYTRMSLREGAGGIIAGTLPLFLFLPFPFWIAVAFPAATFAGLYLFMKRKLEGYSGDCCGATFLLCELSFYAGIVLINQLYHPL